ncbi:MAG: YigZ family protein [Bacteroidota bacterium]
MYRTLSGPSQEVIFVDKKSKFYGFSYPLAEEGHVLPTVKLLRRQFPKANHVCYAWQTGIERKQFRFNDDGEPKNSAGAPIYGQIQSFQLTNVLVCVVRVFGGTKLGVGGLINAYRSAARLALEAATIVEREVTVQLLLRFDYTILDKVMRVIKQQRLTVVSKDLEMDCSITLNIPKKDLEAILRFLSNLKGLKIKRAD